MWSTSCRCLLIVAVFIGYISLQVSAAALRLPESRNAIHESSHSARTIKLSERVHEVFRRAELDTTQENSRRTALSETEKSEDLETELPSSASPAFIPRGADLTPGLPQWVTNGRSTLGTKQARQTRRQDGDVTSSSVNTATGEITRKYKFTVNYADISPDGVLRNRAILINNAFPGPTIEANYGDWIEVEVTNGMTDAGTTMHWHGLLQKESQWMDGVPSIQQCPIAPGQTFTYRFRADQVGTSWWHSHLSAQYTSGAFGAMIIHGGGETAAYDEDIGPVFLSDWYHRTLDDALQITMSSPNLQPPAADNLLINGKMNFPCEETQSSCIPNAGVSKFFFSPGKKYRLRLINSGAAVEAKFSIDGHSFAVMALDFTPIVPYQTDMVSLANGQRADIVVEANGAQGSSYWMRMDIGDGSSPDSCIKFEAGKTRTALAAIYYDGADENSVPSTTTSIDPQRLVPCSPEAIETLVPAEAISSTPQGSLMEIVMNINFSSTRINGEVKNHWTINDTPYQADYSRALLSKAQGNALSTDSDFMSLYDVGSSNTVRVIMYDYFQFSHHPMHLHGHNFQVLAEGYGAWDGSITNPSNPMRRDVHVLNRATLSEGNILPAYTVIQFFTDNPGIWPFHCHLAWHNSAGLYANFMVNQPAIEGLQIPDSIADGCASWNNFDAVANFNSIDSGI